MMLADAAPIPNVDPLGLPAAPAWFVFLLLLTMFLHVVFMNFALGGNVLAVGLNAAGLLGRRDANRTATIIYQVMPPAISMAITMGVAPLLFVQVLYGPYFYSANVLMGLAWFSFVVVLLAGFYLSYWLTYRGSNTLQQRLGAWDAKPGRRLVVSVVATACFLWVAWVFTTNHEMTLRPDEWAADGRWASPRWTIPSPTLIPRYLHNVVGATAIAGLWVAAIGWWRIRRKADERAVNLRIVRFGLISAAALSGVQVVVGIGFLFALEDAVRAQLMGFNTVFGGIWTGTLILAIGLPVLLVFAAMKHEQFRWFLLAAADAVLVLAGMLLGREQVRWSSLALPATGEFSLSKWAVYPQSASLMIFLALLVAGLAVVGLMLWWMLTPPGQTASSASPDTSKSATEKVS